MIGMKGFKNVKKEFKDNCYRCAKACNCYSRDNCKFEPIDFNHAFNEGFVDGDISPLPDYSNECRDII